MWIANLEVIMFLLLDYVLKAQYYINSNKDFRRVHFFLRTFWGQSLDCLYLFLHLCHFYKFSPSKYLTQ